MKKFALVLTLMVCFTFVGYANTQEDVYQFPKDINQQLDRTYQMIHRTIEVDDKLIYDVFLFDEYFMTLSAISRGEAGGFGLEGVREYYQLSLERYQLDQRFMVLVMVYDPEHRVDLEKFSSKVSLHNSKGHLLHGGVFDQYQSVYVLTFPKNLVQMHTKGDKLLTVQIEGHDGSILQTSFHRNYQKKIPWKIWELNHVLKETDLWSLEK